MSSTVATSTLTVTDDFSALVKQGTPVSKILANIDSFKYNPSAIQRLALGALSDVSNGEINIVDATNPFVFLLEASAVNTVAAIIDNNTTTRQLYPALAQTVEDLYNHMSDQDFIDRFAIPASVPWSIMIEEKNLYDKMVLDPLTGIRRATIPRNTEFLVNGMTFSLQYPIDIELLSHNGLQVVYDNSKPSPLQELTSNLVFNEFRSKAGSVDRYLYLQFEVFQFEVKSDSGSINSADGYSTSISFDDSYYYTRVYFKPTSATDWQEIRTTHTDMVYDPTTPTAVLKVVEGQVGVAPTVSVSIPQIYLTSGQISGSVRVDVYSTKGDINVIMSNYAVGAFQATWRNIDPTDDTPYTNVMGELSSVIVYSTGVVSGGQDALTFEELRQRVIMNSVGAQQIPITPAQIQARLQNKGYTIVQNVDVVTDRQYLATKPVPMPETTSLLTAAATSVETLQITIAQALAQEGVYDNTDFNRITIGPDLIYENVNGVITPISSTDRAALLAMPITARARVVNSKNYLFTPFHYVLDTNDDAFEMRPYYLANPQALAILFEDQNDTTGFQVNTAQYSIEQVDAGYLVQVVTVGNSAYQALADEGVFAVLTYVPNGEVQRAYVLGTQVGLDENNNRIFAFRFDSNFDVDAEDFLRLTSFKMNDNSPRIFDTALTNKFDILYLTDVELPQGYRQIDTDAIIPGFLVPAGTVAITQELLTLEFGSSLTTLWSRARTVVASSIYQTYPADVPMFYEVDTYQADINGSIFHFDGDGNIVYNLLHRAGDQVLDVDGNPVYKHLAGDIVLDAQGDPIPITNETVQRQIDLLFIEGIYYFVTDQAAVTYAETIVQTMVKWLTSEIADIDKVLLEQTSIYYYPKTNMGVIKVFVDGQSEPLAIQAGQTLTLNLYVTQQVHDNDDLKTALTDSSIGSIDTAFDQETISMKDVEQRLRTLYGDDVISFTLNGLGGPANYATVSVVDPSERISIRKILLAQPDGTLTAAEAVEVNFLVHQTADAVA